MRGRHVHSDAQRSAGVAYYAVGNDGRETYVGVHMTRAQCRRYQRDRRAMQRGTTNLIDAFVRSRRSRVSHPVRRQRFHRVRVRASRPRRVTGQRARRAATDSGGSSDGDGPPRRRLRRAARGPPGRALTDHAPERQRTPKCRASGSIGRVARSIFASGLLPVPGLAKRRYHNETGKLRPLSDREVAKKGVEPCSHLTRSVRSRRDCADGGCSNSGSYFAGTFVVPALFSVVKAGSYPTQR